MVERGAAYDGRGIRIFDRTVEISSSVNWTTLLKYASTPPYFSSSSERNANMVSGLHADIQKNIPNKLDRDIELPAGEHIESCLVVGCKERLFPKACHDLLPSRFSTHSSKGVVFGYGFVVYACELAYSVRGLITDNRQHKPSTKVPPGRQSCPSQQCSGTCNRSPDYL